MKAIKDLFEHQLPTLLAAAPRSQEPWGMAFVIRSGPAKGFWMVLLHEGCCRRGTEQDAPHVVVEGEGQAVVDWLTGRLDAATAVKRGALEIRGDPVALTALAASLRQAYASSTDGRRDCRPSFG